DPAMVLSRVDSLVTGMRIPRTASLVYATLTRRDGSWTLRYSRAGHLPALLRRDGKVEALDAAGGQLVGFDGSERETALHTLLPGDVLVLYTDGLVERRDRSMRRGLEELVRLTESIRGPDAAGIGEELLQLANAPEDDIAVVVIRVPGGEGAESQDAPRRRRWQIPADPSAISRARQEVRQACEVWQVSDAAAAELVVSELVSNAVMHGRGQIGLRLQALGDGGLRIEVEDGNPAPPVTREQHTSRVGGYGMHLVDRPADRGWPPTPGGKAVCGSRSRTATRPRRSPASSTPHGSAGTACTSSIASRTGAGGPHPAGRWSGPGCGTTPHPGRWATESRSPPGSYQSSCGCGGSFPHECCLYSANAPQISSTNTMDSSVTRRTGSPPRLSTPWPSATRKAAPVESTNRAWHRSMVRNRI